MMREPNCALWDYDDVPRCSRNTYLNYYVPLVTLSISFVILVIKSLQSYFKKSPFKLADESRPLLATTKPNYSETDADRIADIKSRHFDLDKLPNTKEDGTSHGQLIEVGKNTNERLRVGLEYVLLAFHLGLSIFALVSKHFKKEFGSELIIPLVNLALWFYLFVIGTIRIINLKKVVIRLPNLWVHSTAIYFFNLIPAIVIFRSTLIGHVKSKVVSNYYIAHFIVSATLFVLNFTASIGDKPSKVYVTNDNSTPSPETVSSIASFVTYSWIDKLIWSSYKKPLVQDDIWSMREEDHALYVLKGFEAYKTTASFSVKIFSHFKVLFAIQGFWALIDSIIIFVPSLLLKAVLEYVADPLSVPKNVAWTLVCLMSLAKFADSVTSGCSLFLGRRVCVRMKAIIIGEIYAKALRRKMTVAEAPKSESADADAKSQDSKKDKKDEKEGGETAELGAIINLMAIDAFKVSEVCGYLHFFVGAFVSIIVCVSLLFQLIGWSALVGAFAIVFLLPINYKIALWFGKLQERMLAVTDKRIQKLNETFQSIRIIKFFAWEQNFFDRVMEIRSKELDQLKSRAFAWCYGSFIWFVTPTLVTLLSFYCYTIVQGNVLTAPVAFTALSLFTLLRAPLDQLSDMTALVIQCKVSLDRVGKFLDEAETTKYEQLGHKAGPNSPEIGFENASFSWNKNDSSAFKLRDINVSFKPGQLNVVIGPTGSGKSSLLMALLGEMDLTEGHVFLPGIIPKDDLSVDPETGLTDSVAYCSQTAWLLNDTIRNNIVFGSAFNQDRYDQVVNACGLARDFEILAAGDSTEIGEKGIALSGGQKQRVSLARALYSNSKTVLLDDCLSAVDSHTALWIYENCITGDLMNNRTCVLVSHNVALTIQSADWVIVMENGRVKSQNTPTGILETGDLGDDDLVRSSVLNSRNQSSTDLKALSEERNEDLKAKSATIDAKLKNFQESNPTDAETAADKNIRTDGKLIEEETKAEGVVDAKVYLGYIKIFGGVFKWSSLIFVYFFSQMVYIAQTWWLRKWTLSTGKAAATVITPNSYHFNQGNFFQIKDNLLVQTFHNVTGSPSNGDDDTLYYISVYGFIGVLYSVVACLRILYTQLAGVSAANRIFKKVLTTVLNARLRFFDKTPIGRIMNRFSKDVEAVDQELIPFAETIFACLIQCISTLVLITAITPGFLILAFLISALYYLVGFFYLTLSRELKRFESITKSPIHQHFSESLTGVATIRAYGVESRFMRQNLASIDRNNKPFFYMWVANRWLCFRTETVGSLVMFFAGVFVLLSVHKLDAGLAGLSLSYAISFSESALWVVRLYSNIEMNMNSVERLQEYLEVEQEPPHTIPETEPSPSWPEHGEIDVKNVSLRYAPELPRVIKNISFHVQPNHKIGIVGRTGAGKSTIITAFFRFLDPETGSITIDGVDICKIGLSNLRQAITIIPQDPTLFTGTIKTNLDPFEEYTEAQMFEALRRVNLISTNELQNSSSVEEAANENQNKFLNLESHVSEGGNNLSQGQRQLMCLARSLLRNPKVILLDEATASIDYESDAMIQQTIRSEFSNSTILTIAHRLRSIIDYDRILVMDAGQVVEYDDPYTLIANKETLFYSMCENSGELDVLTKLAKESFVVKKNSKR